MSIRRLVLILLAGMPSLAVTNATVLTVTKGTLTRGTVIVRDGGIAAVSANVAVPAGAEVVLKP